MTSVDLIRAIAVLPVLSRYYSRTALAVTMDVMCWPPDGQPDLSD